MALKPWRDVIVPHEDVLNGNFQESEFAADLTQVVRCTAKPEYQDPEIFFDRTYVTEGMELLLDSVIRRLIGKGGDPVVQLKTAFGGGKTHSLMAVYHVAKGEKPASRLRYIPCILDRVGVMELPKARVVVLDGGSLSPSQPTRHGDKIVRTLWGELAWQLDKDNAYDMISLADKDGTSPGKTVLIELFRRYSPCIILMDEVVAYVRQFEEEKSYSGGTYGSNMSFLQALTEAVSQVSGVMVLAALPESKPEAGGERGEMSLANIEKIFGRIEAIWKPVSTEESFEIVRRRLFQAASDEEIRDKICRAFYQSYQNGGGTYPPETGQSEYFEKLKSAYPIHPEVFERLYEDWATLERFQRTRGVLRLMAMVIHRLWVDNNKDMMIMPGSLPLKDTQIRNEMLRYLPQGWEPIIEKDVDSVPASIDQKNTLIGSIEGARRVARCIFLGSAPSVEKQRVRGIGVERIRLGCVQPGEQPGKYEDALRRMTDMLHHLYSGNQRYWYDTRPNLRREMEERKGRYQLQEHIFPEIQKRFRQILKDRSFGGVHIFVGHGDVPDDQQVRLIVLQPDHAHRRKDMKSMAIKAAGTFLTQRGLVLRHFKNCLIFLAADERQTANMTDHAKSFLAWKSIEEDEALLNLDYHQKKEAKEARDKADERLGGAIKEAYCWVLSPYQEVRPQGGMSEIFWEEQRISVSHINDMMKGIIKVSEENEFLISSWSPIHLNTTLTTWFWKENRKDCFLSDLWDAFCRYPYLKRLANKDVLIKTVADGVRTRDYFGYANGKKEERYSGLIFGSSCSVYMDKESLIVHPEAAAAYQKQKSEDKHADSLLSEKKQIGQPSTIAEKVKGFKQPELTNSHAAIPKHFHGEVKLNSLKAGIEFATVFEEVIQHFSAILGADVKIRVEIDAHSPNGIKEDIRRTVQENCRTLGFEIAEFEGE